MRPVTHDSPSSPHAKMAAPSVTASVESSAGVISLLSDEDSPDSSDSLDSPDSRRQSAFGGSLQKKQQQQQQAADGGRRTSLFLWQFLRKHSCGGVDVEGAVRACSRTPYCLYLYGGAELGCKQTTSVVLVGYLDPQLGASVVRPLLTLQMSGDAPKPVGPSACSHTPHADADAGRLMEALTRLDLHLPNLAVFYCDRPHPSVSRPFVSQLRLRSPRFLSLCGVPDMAARACQAGFSAAFGGVPTLIREVHQHYCSSRGSARCPLKSLFLGAGPYNPASPVAANCMFIIGTVQKLASGWKPVLDYFRTQDPTGKAGWIRTQLMDPRVQLEFLFLSQVLQPLGALQEQQRSAAGELLDELRTVPMVVQAYADSVLRPSRQSRDLRALHGHQDLLPAREVNLGHLAREFLWATPVAELQEADRARFLKSAQAFHQAVLQSLVASVPEPLEDGTLRDIASLLNQPESLMENDSYRRVLPALGVQLGLCAADSPEAEQLASDFLSLIQTEDRGPAAAAADRYDQRWAKVLERTRPTPLQRLLRTLLALPASLRQTAVFAKMSESCRALGEDQETLDAPPPPGAGSRRAGPHRWRVSGAARLKPAGGYRNPGGSDSDTDNSSDVVDVTEEAGPSQSGGFLNAGGKNGAAAAFRARLGTHPAEARQGPEQEVVVMLSSDEEDHRMDSSEPAAGAGDLVWGVMEGFPPWPAVTLPRPGTDRDPQTRLVQWFGQGISSEVRLQNLSPFTDFIQNFCQQSFSVLVTYREAVSLALQEAALRRVKQFSPAPETEEEKLQQMIDWAFEEFQSPPGGRQPSGTGGRQPIKKKLFPLPPPSADPSGRTGSLIRSLKDVSVSLTRLSCTAAGEGLGAPGETGRRERDGEEADRARGRGGRGGRGQRKRSSLPERPDTVSPRFGANRRKNNLNRFICRGNRETSVYQLPDQKLREETIRRITEQNLDIEGQFYRVCCSRSGPATAL